MKILVISHNVFSKTSNMGKTLLSYFEGMNDVELAQFYIHSEIPTNPLCKKYYRITDRDAIKSILLRKSGKVFGEKDIRTDILNARTDKGHAARLYQKARKRSPLIYFARNLWWQLGKWNTKKLNAWVDDFSPDVVFFASGDYAFMYRIALQIAQRRNIPLAISCMDDYYFYNKNAGRFGGKFLHRCFMKQVKRAMDYAFAIFPICEKMGREYGEYFGKPYYTLCTPSAISAPLALEKTNAISYVGNLGYKRNEQIVSIGRALKALDLPGKPDYIDVYSMEKDPQILKDLTEENGICFHGGVSAEQVLEIIGQSLAIIHTEAFDPATRKVVAYSVSTKIADSLASGTCLLAYGPAEVASMEYLIENRAAFCVTNEAELSVALHSLLTDGVQREIVIANALALARENHNSAKNCEMLSEKLMGVREQ